MNWESIRTHYPDQWILLEAIDAHSENGKRVINKGSVVNHYKESKEAISEYKALHRDAPTRELYVVHTSKNELEIIERKWLGIRI